MNRSTGPAPSAPSLQELRAARGKPSSAARRFRKWIIAGGVVAALVLFGFFGLPPIVKARAIKQLSARLGRVVTIEQIRINPLVLSATIEGFAVAEAGPAAGEFTGWRRLYVNFDSWSVFRGEIRFEHIELDGFRARAAKKEDGSFNFDDIVARVTAPDPASPVVTPSSPAKPLRASIGRLSVTDARLEFADASRDRPFATTLGPISFSLNDFHTVGDPRAPYQFEAATASGERLAWRGTMSADPVKSEGELVLANIDLARLSPYYHQLARGELRSAIADVSGRYAFSMKDGLPVVTLANGALTLRDVRFGAPGSAADAFALRRLAVSGVSADSAASRAGFGKISVEGVRVKAVRDAEGIDLLRLLAPPAAGAAPATAGVSATTVPGSLPVVTLGEFAVSDVQVDLVDLTTPRRAEHRIEDLTLTLRDLNTADLAKAVPVTLEVKLPGQGRVALAGTATARPLAAELDVTLENVPFANASPYVEPFVNVRLAGGVIRTAGKATLRDGVAGFAGDFGIAGFSSVDGKLAQDFVKWSDLAVTGIRAGTSPLAFHADLIRFVEPSALLRVEADGTLNIARAGQVSAPTPDLAEPSVAVVSRTGAPAPLPLAVSVDRFELQGAAFRYEDRSSNPVAHGSLTGFSGSVSGLSSENLGRADVDLRGQVDGVAPVEITGKLNPLGVPAFVDLKLDFRGIDLQPGAGPYIARFIGRDLSRGNFSLAVTARLNERRLDMDNVVTLDQFYLGQKNNSPDGTSLPVNLALALLRDTQGRIILDVPVKGSLDDPNFKIGRVVVRVLVNILTKAATSPFSLLGSAFGGGGDELGWQEFAPGSTTPDAAGIQKLATVAKALNARPALGLDVVGSHDTTADLDALRRVRLDASVRAAAWETRRAVDPNTPPPEQLDITPELRAGMLAKLYAQAFPASAADAGGEPVVPAPDPAPVEPATRPAARGKPVQVGRLPKYSFVPTGPNVMASRPVRRPAPAEAAAPLSAAEGEGGVAAGSAVVPAGDPGLSPAETEARLIAGIEISAAELGALADARAQSIRTWLVETGKVAPERILLGPVASSGTRATLNLR